MSECLKQLLLEIMFLRNKVILFSFYKTAISILLKVFYETKHSLCSTCMMVILQKHCLFTKDIRDFIGQQKLLMKYCNRYLFLKTS